MKLSRVWPAVRQTMVTAVICVATSSGVAHRVTSQTVDFEFLKLAPFKPNATRLVQPDDQKKPDAAHPQEARRAEMKSFYARWVGVRAAELGQAARDHDGKLVTLSSFRGKRVLLFSFDAGNFNREPDETAVLTNLRALDKARKTVGHDKVAVVGFTQGIAVDLTGDGTKEWIISPNWRELVVLSARGRLLARIEATGRGFPAWTAVERTGKKGWSVAVEANKVSAFDLAAKN